jgi:beta-glucosidase
MRVLRGLFLPCLLLLTTTIVFAQQNSDDLDRKVDDLLKQMTIEEKAGQLTQLANKTPESLAAIRQGKVGSLLGVLGAENANEAQRAAVENSRQFQSPAQAVLTCPCSSKPNVSQRRKRLPLA